MPGLFICNTCHQSPAFLLKQPELSGHSHTRNPGQHKEAPPGSSCLMEGLLPWGGWAGSCWCWEVVASPYGTLHSTTKMQKLQRITSKCGLCPDSGI